MRPAKRGIGDVCQTDRACAEPPTLAHLASVIQGDDLDQPTR